MTFVEGYHVCLVVRQLRPACHMLSEMLDLDFAMPASVTYKMRSDDVERQYPIKYTYSKPGRGGMLVEVVEAVPDTIWTPGERDIAVHHMGFYAENVGAKSAQMSAAGMKRLMTAEGPEEVNLFAYHEITNGPLVEFVDVSRRDSFDQWMSGDSWDLSAPNRGDDDRAD